MNLRGEFVATGRLFEVIFVFCHVFIKTLTIARKHMETLKVFGATFLTCFY